MSMLSVGELMIIVVCGSMIVDAQVNVTMDISTSYFICIDGCNITASWYNDSYCDCSECEDELLWNCTSCGGCPSVCGDSNDCSSIGTTAFATFTCNDGCDIDASYTDDDYCDCSECEDESSWNCTMCGGCVTVCGDYIDCLASSTVSPSTTSATISDGTDIDTTHDDEQTDSSGNNDNGNYNNTTMADSNENGKANTTLIATTGEDINIHQANGAFITMTGSFITIILIVATTLLV